MVRASLGSSPSPHAPGGVIICRMTPHAPPSATPKEVPANFVLLIRILAAEQMSRMRMCRQWQLSGSCLNGAACLYAHGEEALAKRQAAAYLYAHMNHGGGQDHRLLPSSGRVRGLAQLPLPPDGNTCLSLACGDMVGGCMRWAEMARCKSA